MENVTKLSMSKSTRIVNAELEGYYVTFFKGQFGDIRSTLDEINVDKTKFVTDARVKILVKAFYHE